MTDELVNVEENDPEQRWLPTSYKNRLSGTYSKTQALKQYDGVTSISKTAAPSEQSLFYSVLERQKVCASNDEYWEQYCTSLEM